MPPARKLASSVSSLPLASSTVRAVEQLVAAGVEDQRFGVAGEPVVSVVETEYGMPAGT